MSLSSTGILVDPEERFICWAVGLVEQNVKPFYGSTWSRSKKRRELTTPGMLFFTRPVADSPVAFAAVLPDDEPYMGGTVRRVLYVYEIQVSPEHQGRGIGSLLIDEIVKYAQAAAIEWILLTHYPRNAKAGQFYKRHGFTLDWSSPDDSPFVVLSRHLGR